MSRSANELRKRRRAEKAQKKSQKKAQKNKLKTKGETMAWWEKQNTSDKTGKGKKAGWFANRNLTKPTVGKDPKTLLSVLYTQKSLDEIARLCKPQAGGSEFQVHYRGTQIIITKPGEGIQERLVFTIPTCFFNMPQKVTTASVDFNLDEVAELSKSMEDFSMEMAKKITAAFPVDFFKDQGFNISIRELEMGSIHRHPGSFGFSGTDLDNQVENPGVIFRNRGCTDKLQVDSVMYIPGNTTQIVTTETRGVTVETAEDGGISGAYLESPTMSFILQNQEESADFGVFFKSSAALDKTTFEFKVDKKWVADDYPEIQTIFEEFLKEMSDYEPQLFIDPTLIESIGYNYHRTSYRAPGINYNDEDEEYYNSFYPKGIMTSKKTKTYKETTTTIPSSVVSSEEVRMQTRPTWRKSHALSLLKNKGVDLTKYSDITGQGSDQDITGVIKALKDKNLSKTETSVFLVGCGYNVATDQFIQNQLNITFA